MSRLKYYPGKTSTGIFLAKHHFHVPQFIVCSSLDEVKEGYNLLNKPVVIKPVDSSGSKGVSKVNDGNLITSAYQSALSFSRAGKVILEEFIERHRNANSW